MPMTDAGGDRWIVAFDPGDEHVGVAIVDVVKRECVMAVEMTPDGAAAWLEQKLAAGAFYEVVIEKFVLYPWLAQQQAWSEMKTSQLIGEMRGVCKRYGMEPRMQGADIKKAATKILRAKQIKSVAKRDRAGGHALDAELHGMYRMLKEYDPKTGRPKDEGAG